MLTPSTITGWLFDVYPSRDGMTVWIIDADGTTHRCFDPFRPSFFLELNAADMKRAESLAVRCPVPLSSERTVRRELYSDDDRDVLRVYVHDPMRFKQAVRYFERFFPHFAFFDSDLLPAQLYLYERNLFPLSLGRYTIDDSQRLVQWTLHDSMMATDYSLPPFSILFLRNANDFVPPKYQTHLQLEVTYDGQSSLLQQETPVETLEALNWHFHRCNPDIVITEYGDALLLPKLADLSRRHGVPLLLNRDPNAGYITTKESSFFQYGKVVHKDGAFELAGRLHIDMENSFTATEAYLDGIFELARLTQIPVQRQARASIGTSMSSMQLSWAHSHGYLIPAKKREPEEFKSAATLILADRGGLIFNPPFGYHENIAELDFASMYPTIMVRQNVSPETVNCRCCRNRRVPELGYTICERRSGIVPETLRPVVERRAHYKRLKKQFKGKDEAAFRMYDRRQNALKWMLVSCFGYLGYKNARFGRIEAHEAVNAFSRDALLTAKEIAEGRGYELVHAIIDCLWLKKPGATEQDYEALGREIAAQTGIDISLEGMYRWILFPASKQDPAITTANRYVGWYRHEEMKMRGIEARRRDTPMFIKKMQKRMLEEMSKAKDVREIESMLPAFLEILHDHVAVLRSGQANPMELVLRRHITKEAQEYTNNSVSAVVAKLVEAMGVHLSAGESIDFIILDRTGKRKPEKAKPLALYAFEDGYDIEQYTEFTLKAADTLLAPFGHNFESLSRMFKPEPNTARRSNQRARGLQSPTTLEFDFTATPR
jgi:DNA polymerase elongation subunit (family B)